VPEALITSDPKIMMGTRITVDLILDKLAAGETVEQICPVFGPPSPSPPRPGSVSTVE